MKKILEVVGRRRFLFLLFLFFMAQAHQAACGQSKSLTFTLKNASLKEVIHELKRLGGYDFVYRDANLETFARRDVNFQQATLDRVMEDCLKGTGLEYAVNGQTIVIRKQRPESPGQEMRKVKGKVTDEQGVPLPGVTIMIKGTTLGTATDAEGKYQLDVPVSGNVTLAFSFVGMKPQEVTVGNAAVVDVKLESDSETLDDVVVTGYFNKSKDSFTGAVTQVKREELRKFGNVNLIEALKMVDPAFKIKENNEMGSDPNTLPDFFVRGEGSFMGNSNVPTFIVDGYEVSLQRVFDMDMDRIESLTILKDASATILYGSRAANGVVVIETRRPADGKFSVAYSNRTSLSVADLMDAREKLEYEQKAGLFDETLASKELLEYIKTNVYRGVHTDWLAQPVRNAVSHSHSLYLEGGNNAVVYGLGANYNRNNGVMKKSFREVLGVSFDLTYRIREKINIRNSFEYSQTKIQNSPYGSFSDYAAANPYNPIYNDEGKMMKTYKNHIGKSTSLPQYQNPMYNASLPYKDEEQITMITDNLSVDYFFTPELRFKGSAALTKTLDHSDKYLSPNHTSFTSTDATKKGSYTKGAGNGFSYNINATLNYTLQAGRHLLFSGVGVNVVENKSKTSSFTATGFLDERFNEIEFAATYLDGSKPGGSEGKDRMIGFLGNVNYSFDNRYFVDLSGRIDGSSKYGKDKRFAPLWSAGIGWNINNEHFLEGADWLTRLTIRGSIGLTGNQNFDPYVARTTMQFDMDQVYYQALGASFMAFGNKDLEWQRSKKRNIGLDLEILQRRLTLRFDYYDDRTSGLLLPVSVTPSLGFASYTENMGEQSNKGYEFDLNAVVIRNKHFDWAVNFSGTHNKNRIEKISEALRALNNTNNADVSRQTQPISMYEEGESLNAIKVVRSLGINPANGKELFLTRKGEITEEWDYRDKIVAGCTDPELEGNIGTNLIWKNFTLNVLFHYSFGGQVYNSTLASRVEGADPAANADKRVLEQRWQQPGDHTFYKDIADRSVSKATSRFVQDYNYLELSNISLSYRFDPRLLKKIGFSALRIGLNSNNLFYASTVKRERGLDYPFARQFTFSLNLNF